MVHKSYARCHALNSFTVGIPWHHPHSGIPQYTGWQHLRRGLLRWAAIPQLHPALTLTTLAAPQRPSGGGSPTTPRACGQLSPFGLRKRAAAHLAHPATKSSSRYDFSGAGRSPAFNQYVSLVQMYSRYSVLLS